MKKRTVNHLAKDFGMKGADMAKLLRDQLGFENIRAGASTVEQADEMMIIARLEAAGYQRGGAAEETKTATPRKKALPGKVSDASGAELEAEPTPKKKLVPGAGSPSSTSPVVDATDVEPAKKQLPKPVPRRKKLETAEPLPAALEPVAAEAAEAAEPATAPEPEPEARPAAAAASAAATETEAAPRPTPTSATPARIEPAPAPAPAPAEAPAVETTAAAEAIATPAAEPAAAEATAQGAQAEPAEADAPQVKKLLMPKAKAQVVGRIELNPETIRDANRRSAPATGNAGRDLRRAALKSTQQRTATRVTNVGRGRGPGGGRGGRDAGKGPQRRGRGPATPITVDPNKEVQIEAPVSIKAFSEALGVKVTELIATLTFKLGVAGKNINSFLTQEEVELVAMELDRKVIFVEHKQAEEEMIEQLGEDAAGEDEDLRGPVVTFMGHVDHGKTSLIDRLRKSDVAAGEAGGITQHIGAYKVTTESGQSFVILDTPGHAAFTSMRARGANLTDVVVLVVAADDGVMPQTEEAINHAKAANVPIVVAINKCDLPGANPMQVKQQLMIKGLQHEDWGGSIGMVEVSAATGKGIDDLVERIMLEAEVLELKARHNAPGRGIVVESKQTPEQGVVVTVLVTDGTLRTKDQVVCGESFSRVRGMIDDHGRTVAEAGPATPVTLLGLDRLPMPGDKLFVVEDAKKAREVVEERQRRARDLSLAERSAVTLETLSAKLAEKQMQEVKLILKADVMGSLEPLRKCLDELTTKEVRVNLVHSALGGISETDVSLAAASGAIIIGFNTVADSSARAAAERAGVEIRYYEVIYELLDDVRATMEGMLAPEEIETVLGHAEVRALFRSSKFGAIAGCYVTDGMIRRNAKARLSRDGKVVYSGKIASLRREKDDAKEVRAGFECGLTLHDFQDIKEGDIIEVAAVEMVKRTLSS